MRLGRRIFLCMSVKCFQLVHVRDVRSGLAFVLQQQHITPPTQPLLKHLRHIRALFTQFAGAIETLSTSFAERREQCVKGPGPLCKNFPIGVRPHCPANSPIGQMGKQRGTLGSDLPLCDQGLFDT